MNATQSQVDYINKLRNSILEEMDKPFPTNLYNGHFGSAQRKAIREESKKVDREFRGEIKAKFQTARDKNYQKWIDIVKGRLDFDPAQLTKSAASAMIDSLKKPSGILNASEVF